MPPVNSRPVASDAPHSFPRECPVGIPHRGEFLTGSLGTRPAPRGVVLIANDRGCARHAAGLCILAAELRRAGFATLMVDVVRPGEMLSPREMCAMAGRIDSARAWLRTSKLAGTPIVLLGMGATAPLALLCAATGAADIAAAIGCGPKPDEAGPALGMVSCPVLLIAHTGAFGDLAAHVRALGRLGGRHELVVLDDSLDPAQAALAVAQAAAGFLAFIEPKDRKAA